MGLKFCLALNRGAQALGAWRMTRYHLPFINSGSLFLTNLHRWHSPWDIGILFEALQPLHSLTQLHSLIQSPLKSCINFIRLLTRSKAISMKSRWCGNLSSRLNFILCADPLLTLREEGEIIAASYQLELSSRDVGACEDLSWWQSDGWKVQVYQRRLC